MGSSVPLPPQANSNTKIDVDDTQVASAFSADYDKIVRGR